MQSNIFKVKYRTKKYRLKEYLLHKSNDNSSFDFTTYVFLDLIFSKKCRVKDDNLRDASVKRTETEIRPKGTHSVLLTKKVP